MCCPVGLRARVRGIYSTAISKILHDNGVELVDVTPSIASRLKVSENRGLPADVTVKTENDNPSQLIVIGFPDAVEEVASILEVSIPDMLVFKPLAGLYATFKTRILGHEGRECVVQSPWGKATLVDYKECTQGRETLVTTIKLITNSSEKIVVSENIRVVGKYAIVGRGSSVTFSHFIRSKERISQLIEISSKHVREGYSIRWRSNSDEASLSEVMAELEELREKYRDLLEEVRGAPPLKVVYEGETARFYELTYSSKLYLDQVRKEVCPTIHMHHVFRGCERDGSLVGLLDALSAKVPGSEEVEIVNEWLLSELREADEVVVEHKKIWDKTIFMRGVIDKVLNEGGPVLQLKRVFRTHGTYDGLDVGKEVGDIALTFMRAGSSHIIHKYFSRDGRLKGVYVNFNTPVEIHHSGRVYYVDLDVDLVRSERSGCRMVDSEGFRRLMAEGVVSQGILESLIRDFQKVLQNVCT
ncbi:MAG: DUF402 domain-containing protein [Zestosphaera sp.]